MTDTWFWFWFQDFAFIFKLCVLFIVGDGEGLCLEFSAGGLRHQILWS